MIRINRLLTDPDFMSYLEKNVEGEKDRIYCHHDLGHALDTARVAYILNLEEGLGLDRELVYAAALTHDLGRWMEYRDGIPHEQASALLAEGLLKRSGFDGAETAQILEAIGGHRASGGGSPLSDILRRADKLSRNCAACAAIGSCKHFQNGETASLEY